MDVAWFFRKRTRLIRFTYERAAKPFIEMKQQIEGGFPPFDDPPHSEDPELPFMAEWSDAETAIVVLGRSCVSMLSASLKLYFKTWEKELDVPRENAKAWRKGFTDGYLSKLCDTLSIDPNDCPADLAVIEQVFLARNRDQHPESIQSMNVKHSSSDRAKHPNPFFISEPERAMYVGDELGDISFMSPSVHVDAEMLHRAIEEAERLVDWLEPQFFALKYPSSGAPKA
ncbi:hypothetical protein [Rhodovulum sulfidophilum]|uniref:hypothetical protein n=1 Tax=Rhodovulum sulfidophilum TaxID=35806 RepID=UPI0019225D0F|nr:hypothetical protein [Rhodovulum sulfidophilum]MBL3562851.1 hypothetical protein [Rhodovulum sulfidophilum]